MQRQGFTKSAVKTIRLVEDYKDTSELLTSFLEGPGYRVSRRLGPPQPDVRQLSHRALEALRAQLDEPERLLDRLRLVLVGHVPVAGLPLVSLRLGAPMFFPLPVVALP